MRFSDIKHKIVNRMGFESLGALRQAGYRVVRERDGDRYFLARENELQPLLVKLGEIAEVRRGFTTGANEFFYLEPVRSAGILPANTGEHGQDARATGGDIQPAEAPTPTYMDPHQPISKRLGARLPHWSQQGATYFVTFRLADSLPQSVVRAWKTERESLMRMAQSSEQTLSPAQRKRLHQLFSEKIDRYLNAGYGACWMKHDEIAEIVANALRYFDGQRYYLWAWCVMPNHVHVVVQPLSDYTLSRILHSWKSYTANAINKRLNRTEPLWQVEYFDHLIRDEEDFEHCVEYTLRNPELAGLSEWRWCGTRSSAGTLPANTEHGQDARATTSSRSAGTLPANTEHGQDARATVTIRVRNGAGWEGNIEACWLRPVIKSPRELKTLTVRPEDLRYCVFMPPDEVRHAIDTGETPPLDQYPHAKAYIEWGEKQGYHRRPTCASRKWWWDLGNVETGDFLWTMTYRERFFVAVNSQAYADARMYEIYVQQEIGALLNSTFVIFMMELEARGYGGGGGPVDVKVYEVEDLQIPISASLPFNRLLSAFHRLSQRPIRSIFEELGYPKPNKDYSNVDPSALTLEQVQQASPDRYELDSILFDVLGLTHEERLAVYRAVVQLVKDRLVKAKSV